MSQERMPAIENKEPSSEPSAPYIPQTEEGADNGLDIEEPINVDAVVAEMLQQEENEGKGR